jgi:hypothetical protein
MALTIGSCSVAEDGSVSGSGLAKAIAEAHTGPLFAAGTDKLPAGPRAYYAALSEALATAIIEHIQAHAEVEVTVTTSDAGLQTTPDPNDPGVPTDAPASDKTLAGTIS